MSVTAVDAWTDERPSDQAQAINEIRRHAQWVLSLARNGMGAYIADGKGGNRSVKRRQSKEQDKRLRQRAASLRAAANALEELSRGGSAPTTPAQG